MKSEPSPRWPVRATGPRTLTAKRAATCSAVSTSAATTSPRSCLLYSSSTAVASWSQFGNCGSSSLQHQADAQEVDLVAVAHVAGVLQGRPLGRVRTRGRVLGADLGEVAAPGLGVGAQEGRDLLAGDGAGREAALRAGALEHPGPVLGVRCDGHGVTLVVRGWWVECVPCRRQALRRVWVPFGQSAKEVPEGLVADVFTGTDVDAPGGSRTRSMRSSSSCCRTCSSTHIRSSWRGCRS